MKTNIVIGSALATALALSLAACAQKAPAPAGSMAESAMADKAQMVETEQCFGVARAGQNDCKTGTHACAGHSTTDRDPASFMLVPAGSCVKIVGGSLTPTA